MKIDLSESGCTFTTFAEVLERYAARIHTFIILGRTSKNPDGSSYKQAFFVCEKQGKYDNLGLIEKLHNDSFRTRDIFSVLNSISSKYTHKPNVYNTMSRQRQRKLQGLDEIEILFKTLRNDENIIDNVATKAIHNDECDQDGAFIQAVFWAYRSAFLDFSIAIDVLVIDATYKTNRFSMPLIVICSIDQF
ncbi:40979_t:CDS:2, partial [Gigaspora margarita]